MKNSFIVIRAIGTEFARRLYVQTLIITSIIDALLVGLMVWLLTISAWWLLLALPVYLLVIASIVLLVVTMVIIRTVAPPQTTQQRQQVRRFVDKLQNLSEIVQTPKFIILFRIMRDIIVPRRDSFIQSTSHDTVALKSDFQALQRSFDGLLIEQ